LPDRPLIALVTFRRPLRTLSACIAILAMLMAALAPTLSQALEAGRGGVWTEVCSATAATGLLPDDAATGDPAHPAAPHTTGHCPYCSLHANSTGLPPAEPAWSLPVVAGASVVAPPRDTPLVRMVWVAALSRGPPSLV
jgi:hypothetical protein